MKFKEPYIKDLRVLHQKFYISLPVFLPHISQKISYLNSTFEKFTTAHRMFLETLNSFSGY